MKARREGWVLLNDQRIIVETLILTGENDEGKYDKSFLFAASQCGMGHDGKGEGSEYSNV
jgi:hypothetical protein